MVAVVLATANQTAISAPVQEHSASDVNSPSTHRWKIGIVVTAANGPGKGIFASTPIPTEWPEQQVEIVDTQKSNEVRRVHFRTLAGGVRQMVVDVPLLSEGQIASSFIMVDITKRILAAPQNHRQFIVPRRPGSNRRQYLKPSPFIESQHPKIRALAKQAVVDSSNAWDQVEVIYDWVRANVRYKDSPLKGALAALRDGEGDCEELTSLFIAMCRASKIPARTVWVPGHCYPEFYLEDATGAGHWFPCQAAGDRNFGQLAEARPILQKGDSFRVPRNPQRQPIRYAQVLGSLPGGPYVHPEIQIVHERMTTEKQ